MTARTDKFDLGRLRLTSGEGRRLELAVSLGRFEFASEHYAVEPELVPVVVDVSKMTGAGLALRLRFSAALVGPCMRCLGPAAPRFDVDAREVNQPGAGRSCRARTSTTQTCSTSPPGPVTPTCSRCRSSSCAAPTAPACALSVARSSTPTPATRTSARRTRVGPPCVS